MQNVVKFPPRRRVGRRTPISLERQLDHDVKLFTEGLSSDLLQQAIANLEVALLKIGTLISAVQSEEAKAKLLDDYAAISRSIILARGKLSELRRSNAVAGF